MISTQFTEGSAGGFETETEGTEKKMGVGKCNAGGVLDTNAYNAPLPVIGVYIAGASVVCMLAMGFDTIDGFRRRRMWFPCRLFSLNATSLTLLGVAAKLSVDLSTPMPRPQDQLTKLTANVFVCVAMAFWMPSLGAMRDPEVLSNMTALFIFVVTVVGNVCTQLGTGVIYRFQVEHVVVLICMLVLLGLMCSTASVVETTRQILNDQYEPKTSTKLYRAEMEYIRDDVTKVWVMAHTGSPQYVLARSVMSTGAGALISVCVLVLIQAEIRSFLPNRMHFCDGRSDYRWGNWPVVVSQTVTILVGSIAPVVRWFNALCYRKPGSPRFCRDDFTIEKFWVKRLQGWKENPLPVHFRHRSVRKRIHMLRNGLLDLCISLQKASVLTGKFVRLISALLESMSRNPYYFCRCICCSSEGKNGSGSSKNLGLLESTRQRKIEIRMNSVLDSSQRNEMHNYVLHLQGEDDLVLWMSSRAQKGMDRWIEKGRREQCGALLQLLSKSSVSEGFKGMRFFDNNSVPPIPTLNSDIPPNCWALPAVTLVAIVIALSRFCGDRIQTIVAAVAESLKLVDFIEHNLDFRGLSRMRKAAAIVWSTIDLREKWLDIDLAKFPVNASNIPVPALDDPNLLRALQIIDCLAEIGKARVMSSEKEIALIPPRQWPPEVLAGNTLYRICRTIIDFNKYETIEDLFGWIEGTLADIVGACLTNLPYAIFVEYVSGSASERESRVRNAVYVLGRAQRLQDVLHWSRLKEPDDENANVDRWRSGEANPFHPHHHDTTDADLPC